MSHPENERLTCLLVVAVTVSVMGSSFQYGYNIAVVNAPAKLIQEYFFDGNDANGIEPSTAIPNNSTSTYTEPIVDEQTEENRPYTEIITNEEDEFVMSDYETFLWSFTVSIYTVGGMIGSFSTGFCVKKMGRKGTLLAINSLSIVGSILMGASKAANSLVMIIVARFLLGVFAGLATGVVPLYIGEISPRHLRGGIGVINQLSITIGILTAQVLSLKNILGSDELWPVLLAFTGIPSVVQLCILPFLPESPRCLLIDKDREDKARKALKRFRDTDDVGSEIREMRLEAQAEASTGQLTTLQVIRDRSVRWQLISILFLQISQQLCGINAIFFYLNTIFEAAGVEGSTQDYASVGVGTVNVLMTVVSVVLMDRAGRKILLGGGYVIAAFFCVLMTVSLNLQDEISWFSWVSIASVIGFIIGFAIGPGPVPWLLTAEFFRQSTRPAASALGCGVNWTFNFALALVFPFMQKGMGPFVFIFFLVVCVAAAAYVFAIVPETKHKTFQEINLLFAKRNHLKDSEVEMEDVTRHIVKTLE